MAFELMDRAPEASELAYFSPEGGLHGVDRVLDAQVRYWRRRLDQARSDIDPLGEEIANKFLDWLHQSVLELTYNRLEVAAGRGDQLPAVHGEANRRMIIGGYASSLFLRRLAKRSPGEPFGGDARGIGSATQAIEMVLDDDGMPHEPRMHLTGEYLEGVLPESPEPVQWYRDGNLLVRRVYPMEPTPTFNREIGHIEFPYAEAYTVYPHIAAQ